MDIKAFKTDQQEYTVRIQDGDFIPDDGFDTVIHMSLLTDARATEDQVAVPENRRGWPGNLVSPVEDRQLGGWLWLVDQSRLTADTLNRSINYAQLSLNHLVEDGLAKSVVVSGEIVPRSGIQLTIVITSVSGVTSTHYVKLWENTGNAA